MMNTKKFIKKHYDIVMEELLNRNYIPELKKISEEYKYNYKILEDKVIEWSMHFTKDTNEHFDFKIHLI